MSLRDRVVREARGWIGTPYHHGARVKGAGVDCAQILIAVYAAAGVIEPFDPGYYPPDWMLHRGEERYAQFIARFADEFDWRATPILPADVVVWRYGRTFSHGAIVTAWPRVVHAYAQNGCVEEADVTGTPMADGRPMRAFRARGIDG